MAFAFPVTFAEGTKKAEPNKKRRKRREPNFPTAEQLAESGAKARRSAEELSNEFTMQSGGVTMTSPEGEVVTIDGVGDLSIHPWVVSCSLTKYLKQESAMQMSCADANGRLWMVDSGCSKHMLSKRSLTDLELKTLRSIPPIHIKTANGWVKIAEEATVTISALDITITCLVNPGLCNPLLGVGRLEREHDIEYRSKGIICFYQTGENWSY